MNAERLEKELPALLESCTGAAVSAVSNLQRMTGGAVREIWSFDAQLRWPPEGVMETRRLVLRAFGPAIEVGLGAEGEFLMLQAMHGAGVPVPKPECVGSGVMDEDFYIMERVDGETIGRRIVRDEQFAGARRVLPAQLAEALARIHRFALHQQALRRFLRAPEKGKSPGESDLARLEEEYRRVALRGHPAFELAFRWLWKHRPRVRETALVHGDFRVGNLICGPEGLRAILDWERAHIGDPMEDVGGMMVRSWRFGADRLEAGGIASRDAFIAAYEAASGTVVDRERVRFWEVFGNLRWGVAILRFVRAFLEGNDNVEWAAIGRRAAEVEWEILKLIRDSAAHAA